MEILYYMNNNTMEVGFRPNLTFMKRVDKKIQLNSNIEKIYKNNFKKNTSYYF